jgi:diaminobutyrate-2-oxoglutarate transaminase
MNIQEIIKNQLQARFIGKTNIGLKINLYRDYEVEALATAIQYQDLQGFCPIECIMVGDSYLTTHLGRESTQLKTPEEQIWGLDVLVSLVAEVNNAIQKYFPEQNRPYLVGDMPDGSTKNINVALKSAQKLIEAGADVIKMEIASEHSLQILKQLSEHNFYVMAHIGYTPQTGKLKRHGDSLHNALEIFALVRKIRDYGACAIVLEMMSEAANQALCNYSKNMLQVYSIFSGKAKYGGQSINVWDAVFKPPFSSKYFPPTAEYSRSLYPDIYTHDVIASKVAELLKLTIAEKFPLSPASKLSREDEEKLSNINPWGDPNSFLQSFIPLESLNTNNAVFEKFESEVRVYCRKFPAVFVKAKGHFMWDEKEQQYLDFLSGGGALNYGHNHDIIKQEIINYLQSDGITHSLDLYTQAKREFMRDMIELILKPRNLEYKMQFTGPTGSNVVEAALKLARKVTGRTSIVAFTNGFHGMSLGALSASGTSKKRMGSGVPLTYVTRLPYDGYFGDGQDTINYIESLLDDPSSGIDLPAAFIVETIQAEGGVITASNSWLQRLQNLAKRKEILLIIDDIQAGCGRTGKYFSFEDTGLYPDIVCLSKSISGYGLPMALLLLKPWLDQQQPGEHSGTFRGNNLAFIAAKTSICFWNNQPFLENLNQIAHILDKWLYRIVNQQNDSGNICSARGRGLLRGIVWNDVNLATQVSQYAFESKVIVETAGGNNQVLKIMPPLTIDGDALNGGLNILEKSIYLASKNLN